VRVANKHCPLLTGYVHAYAFIALLHFVPMHIKVLGPQRSRQSTAATKFFFFFLNII
jgi:hypothetical protein